MSMTILIVNTLALLFVLYALAIKGLGRIEETVNEIRESSLRNDPSTTVELTEMNPVATLVTLDQEEEDRKDLEEVGVIADDDEKNMVAMATVDQEEEDRKDLEEVGVIADDDGKMPDEDIDGDE